MRTTDKLIIFDTTMRDGEQSPGASMTREEKLRIARALERMKVDVIEAGFPASSNGDFEAVRAIANAIKDSVVCGCAAPTTATSSAASTRSRAQILAHPHLHRDEPAAHGEEAAHDARAGARAGEALGAFRAQRCPDVEFSPEDGSRSELDFLCRVLETVINEGARPSTSRIRWATRCRSSSENSSGS